ncbi:cytochrome P450, partial [Chytridium lagenaria]
MTRSVTSTALIATATAAVAIPAAFLAYLHSISRKPVVKGVPHPPPPPIIGSIYSILSDFDSRYETFTQWANTYGPTCRERLHRLLNPLLGDGIFSTDGHQWKWQRKVSSHIFTGKNFREVVETVIHEDMKKLVTVLGLAADDNREIDLHLYLHCLTMDTFGKIGFGIDLNALENPSSPPPFAKSFDTVLPILNRRFANPFFWVVEPISGDDRVLMEHMKIVNGFDLLDLYIAYDPDMTDKQLRDMCLNMMLAGRDTTAQALSWAFWILSSHPDVAQKIHDEVTSLMGDRLPGYDEVNQLKYTNAVFMEVLRLHPSVPGDFKVAVEADVLPGGIHIPAGTQVNWLPYAMGRMESLWGPDATSFNPSRWLDENNNIRRESQYKWAVFNAGPRVCLGQQMATVEGVMTLATLCREFEFQLMPNANVRYGSSLTL